MKYFINGLLIVATLAFVVLGLKSVRSPHRATIVWWDNGKTPHAESIRMMGLYRSSNQASQWQDFCQNIDVRRFDGVPRYRCQFEIEGDAHEIEFLVTFNAAPANSEKPETGHSSFMDKDGTCRASGNTMLTFDGDDIPLKLVPNGNGGCNTVGKF